MNRHQIRKPKTNSPSSHPLLKSQKKSLSALLNLAQNPENFEKRLPSYFKSREKKKLRSLPVEKVDALLEGIACPQCNSFRVVTRLRCIGMDQEREIMLSLNRKNEEMLKTLMGAMENQNGLYFREKTWMESQNDETNEIIQRNEDPFQSISEIINESKEDADEMNLAEICRHDRNLDLWVFGQTSPQYF